MEDLKGILDDVAAQAVLLPPHLVHLPGHVRRIDERQRLARGGCDIPVGQEG